MMIYRNAVALAASAVLGLSAVCSVTHTLCEGEAHWTECHEAGQTRVSGWVRDDKKADGKCAWVRTSFSNGAEHNFRACDPKIVRLTQ